MKLHVSIYGCLVLLCARLTCSSEMYTSSVLGLVKLLDIENKFVLHMKEYAEAQEQKLETLKIYLKTLEHVALKSKKEQNEFVSNPLQVFSLIRRLREDWPKLQVLTKEEVGAEQLQAMTELLDLAPTKEDMDETLEGMDRIEVTYDFNPFDIAKGLLNGQQFNHTLSIRDCLAMARHKYGNKNYGGAFVWYSIALKREREPNSFTYDKVLGGALDGVREQFARMRILKDMTENEPLLSEKQVRERVDKILKSANSTALDYFVNELLEQDDSYLMAEGKLEKSKVTSHYVGCRDQFPKRTHLTCRYNSTTTPFLKLAPLKLEEINLDPYIVMYHNVISDSEIEEMKRQTVNMSNGLSAFASWNQSQPARVVARVKWLMNPTPFVERMNNRITDMTGFQLQEFPSLLVANYGIGAFFQPHYDYVTTDRVRVEDNYGLGDRSASVVFYASNLEGGSTVFTELQLTVRPQKGSSLVWYNLFDDDTPDPRSRHSVCPTITGSRWILIKWIHSLPQTFAKPCQARPAQPTK